MRSQPRQVKFRVKHGRASGCSPSDRSLCLILRQVTLPPYQIPSVDLNSDAQVDAWGLTKSPKRR